MKKILITALCLLSTLCFGQQINIKESAPFSPYVFGHNLEHTRTAIQGGLSAQMLMNRKFAEKPYNNKGLALGWYGIGERTYFANDERPTYTRHVPTTKRMSRLNELEVQAIQNMYAGELAGICQYGLGVKEGTEYEFRAVAKANYHITLNISLTDRSGKKVYCQKEVKIDSGTVWNNYSVCMTSSTSDEDACVRYTYKDQAKLTFGALSVMPKDNFHGMRKDVIENLKAIGPKIIRWPGGNFAGEYRWKDGLLPVDERGPMGCAMFETQANNFGFDNHEINTDDFIALCREVGAEPFITINLFWSTPEESAEWVEYCNGSSDTKYGKLRAERGHKEPYNVHFWSLGNEMGYGHMEGPKGAAGYAEMAGPHADAMLKVTPDMNIFSSGPYPNDDWAKNSAATMADKVQYVSVHNYTGWGTYTYTDEASIRKTYNDMMNTLKGPKDRIVKMRNSLNKTDKGDKLHISFDEWNIWFSWYRPSCVAEGIHTARTLHMMITESNPMDMPVVCYFQPINEGAILVDKTSSRLTADGQMFEMIKSHADGNVCQVTDNDDYSTLASIKDGVLTITLVNFDYEKERTFSFNNIKGMLQSSTLYYNEDVRPHTYFEQKPLEVTLSKSNVTTTLPAHSAAKIQIKLK